MCIDGYFFYKYAAFLDPSLYYRIVECKELWSVQDSTMEEKAFKLPGVVNRDVKIWLWDPPNLILGLKTNHFA